MDRRPSSPEIRILETQFLGIPRARPGTPEGRTTQVPTFWYLYQVYYAGCNKLLALIFSLPVLDKVFVHGSVKPRIFADE